MIPVGMMRTRMTLTTITEGAPDSLGQATVDETTTTELIGHVESNMVKDARWNYALAADEDVQVVIPYVTGVLPGHTITVWGMDGETETSTLYNITRIEDDRNRHRWLRLGLGRSLEVY